MAKEKLLEVWLDLDEEKDSATFSTKYNNDCTLGEKERYALAVTGAELIIKEALNALLPNGHKMQEESAKFICNDLMKMVREENENE